MGVGLGGLGEIIDSLTLTEQRIADFIANGPGDGIQGHVRDGYRHRCREFANLPGWARLLTGGAGGSVSRLCTPYWDDNGWDGPTAAPEFTGGQCPGTIYRVSWVTSRPGQPNNSFSVDRPGPLSIDRSPDPGDSSAGCPTGLTFNRFVLRSGGEPVGIDSGCGVAIVSFTVEPLFGGSDDCGDYRPDPYPGPNPPPYPGPLPGPEPTEDPDIPGLPRIPIPPYEDPVYGPIPIEPVGEPGGGGGGGGGGTPAPSPELGDPISFDPGDAPGDIDFGDPPEGRVWAGAFLRLNGNFVPFGVAPDSAPGNAALARVVGNASLIFEPELPSTARGTATQVRSEWSAHIVEILGLPVSGLRVNMNPSLGFTVFPVSVIDPEGSGDSADG